MKIKQKGNPTTAVGKWLQRYFRGSALVKDFVPHMVENYRTHKGTCISRRAVISRIEKAVACNQIEKSEV